MKTYSQKVVFISLFLGFFIILNVISVTAQNSIHGMVFDNTGKPVSNINVELLDEYEQFLRRTETRGGGTYSFSNLRAGIYYILIRTGGTPFQEVKERIELGITNRSIRNASGAVVGVSGADTQQVSFYLKLNSEYENQNPQTTDVIFAQNVSENARQKYEDALRNIKDNKNDEALINLKAAVIIFPEFFDALEKLGELYLSQQKFTEAENILKKAVEVNPKSFVCFFNLAIAQNNLKKKVEAVNTLKEANDLVPDSINSHLLLGIIQRDLKNFKESETAFIKAKKLGDNQVPDVHWNLALLYYYDLKRYPDAADELELYLKTLSPEAKKGREEEINRIKKLIKTLRDKSK
jgi:tetratricopeptide (TPR) repeat protein